MNGQDLYLIYQQILKVGWLAAVFFQYLQLYEFLLAMSKEERVQRDMEQMPKRRRTEEQIAAAERKELSKAMTADGK